MPRAVAVCYTNDNKKIHDAKKPDLAVSHDHCLNTSSAEQKLDIYHGKEILPKILQIMFPFSIHLLHAASFIKNIPGRHSKLCVMWWPFDPLQRE